MPAYLIANIDILNPEGYEQYRSRSRPIVEHFGGRFLVRGGDVESLEGAVGVRRMVVIEFTSRAAARTFYDSPDYQTILPFRRENASTDMFIVDGFDG